MNRAVSIANLDKPGRTAERKMFIRFCIIDFMTDPFGMDHNCFMNKLVVKVFCQYKTDGAFMIVM